MFLEILRIFRASCFQLYSFSCTTQNLFQPSLTCVHLLYRWLPLLSWCLMTMGVHTPSAHTGRVFPPFFGRGCAMPDIPVPRAMWARSSLRWESRAVACA